MDINYIPVISNKTTLMNPNGFSIPMVFSSAWNFSSITEDIYLRDEKSSLIIPFRVIPLSEGKLSVVLASGDNFTISEVEVKASQGLPLPYLIRRIYQGSGTTVTSLNIGI